MTIYVFPADRFGCGFYRLGWPAQALIDRGEKVKIIWPSAREGLGGSVDTRTGRLLDASAPSPQDPFGLGREMPSDAEAVIMQRVSDVRTSSAVRMLRAKGIPVVVDMDDDLTSIDPNNPAFRAMQVKGGVPRHNWRNAHQACLDASLVTVSTPALLPIYAPHGRGVVIENRVPARFLAVPHADGDCFGWPGAIHSHPQDPQVIGPAAARLVREGWTYWSVGGNDGYTAGDGALRRALGLEADPPGCGSVAFVDWPEHVAHLGIGLAPLADTRFNAAKSWLKPLEMMACGVPWVGSPRAEYQRLHKATGLGTLAGTPQAWYRGIKRLLENGELRAEESQAGRDVVAAAYTIEGNAWRWLEAWRSAKA